MILDKSVNLLAHSNHRLFKPEPPVHLSPASIQQGYTPNSYFVLKAQVASNC
jgi:hypothetical protein